MSRLDAAARSALRRIVADYERGPGDRSETVALLRRVRDVYEGAGVTARVDDRRLTLELCDGPLGRVSHGVSDKLSVRAVYAPQVLRDESSLGLFDPKLRTLFLSSAAIVRGEATSTELHEIRHAWHERLRARGRSTLLDATIVGDAPFARLAGYENGFFLEELSAFAYEARAAQRGWRRLDQLAATGANRTLRRLLPRALKALRESLEVFAGPALARQSARTLDAAADALLRGGGWAVTRDAATVRVLERGDEWLRFDVGQLDAKRPHARLTVHAGAATITLSLHAAKDLALLRGGSARQIVAKLVLPWLRGAARLAREQTVRYERLRRAMHETERATTLRPSLARVLRELTALRASVSLERIERCR